jgi:LysR family transcriptional regulator, low CO2-responsive transcriptional regulator
MPPEMMDNPLVVIAAPTQPLAGQQRIPLERLAEEPYVGREPGSGTRGAVEKFFSEHDLTLKAAMEMNKNEAIKQAVEAGLGLGVVSLHTVQAELAARLLCVLDVQGFPLRRQWYLVQRQGKRLSPAAQAFAIRFERGRTRGTSERAGLRPRPATSNTACSAPPGTISPPPFLRDNKIPVC